MKKVLIANRGEIGCRIIRACRAEQLEAVAIYSPVDAAALHVEMADEAVEIPADKPVQSYLAAEQIVAAALDRGADAVHPGYGFLAENAGFARRVEEAGLIFIGPKPETIAAMGDKGRAREIALATGVPILEGSATFARGSLQGIEEAARTVGYPLLVKASSGGGGIGMRIVDGEAKLLEVVESTQTLAERSFGDGSVFLERYIAEARHVEMQVFGFGDGEVVHLFERECSIQRRFQKIIEESPSPGIGEATRAAMARAAVALASHVRYRGAGTLEFIVDERSGDFFFLEMNTRIQVEHPVTEMVTGTDLVRAQLRLAAGSLDRASLAQDNIRLSGHAIEARLCAENPARMFLPSPGELKVLVFPEASATIRVETGLRQGERVTAHFDPMIAKLIVHASTRDEAIERMSQALKGTELGSFTSNLPLLQKLVTHEAFRRGDTFTNFIERHREELGI